MQIKQLNYDYSFFFYHNLIFVPVAPGLKKKMDARPGSYSFLCVKYCKVHRTKHELVLES